jgi:predicted AAA+ superfamily ATPase
MVFTTECFKEQEARYLTGSIFENFVIEDIQKEMLNRKSMDRLVFFREKNENEVDLLVSGTRPLSSLR